MRSRLTYIIAGALLALATLWVKLSCDSDSPTRAGHERCKRRWPSSARNIILTFFSDCSPRGYPSHMPATRGYLSII
ncbi:MAG: hypothetical protein LBF69_01585 [Prevotellaceae bacterium]|nr:hypothetical protein [Prevotellaceae bacterium]